MMGGRRWELGVLLVAALLLSVPACFGGSTPRRYYYSLEYPRGEAVQRYVEPRYPFTVRIRGFSSSVAYDRQEMVYRATPYEISYDWYRLWAAKPRKMLAAVAESHLRDANLFRMVVERLSTSLPRYEFTCEVLAIEELDTTPDEWWARLAMRCVLVDFETGGQVWRRAFDEKRQVFQRKPRFVVRALSQLMEAQMALLVEDLDAYLGGVTGAPAPARVARPVEPVATPKGDGADAGGVVGPGPGEPSARLKPRK